MTDPDPTPPVDPWASAELPTLEPDPTPATVPTPRDGGFPRGVASVRGPEPAPELTYYEPVYTFPPRRRWPALVGVLVVVALVAFGIAWFATPKLFGRSANGDGPTSPGVSTGPTATGPTVTTQPPAGPYDGTAAASYAKGADGIVLPTAEAKGDFSRDQVATALQKVREALVASRLDTTMLTGHDTGRFLGLLGDANRKDIQQYFDKKDFDGFATQIATGQSLASDPVRVKGTISVSTETSAGGVRQLRVTTNFVWAYGFTGASKSPGDRLVVIHDEIAWKFAVDSDVKEESRGLRLSEWHSIAYNIDCGLIRDSQISPPTSTASGSGGGFDPRQLDPGSPVSGSGGTC